MKNIIFWLASLTIVSAACSNSATEKKDSNISKVQPTVAAVDTLTKPSSVTGISIISIKEIVDNYLQIKNAFAKDNSANAATAAKEMAKAFTNFNKSALTAEQAKIYADIEDDAKEHAEHIGSNGGNIKHQREHFDMLSKDIYQLVKTFGGGQKLYYDHCPMYNNNKGAYWLSETKEIANPYLGKVMPTCGTVKEALK